MNRYIGGHDSANLGKIHRRMMPYWPWFVLRFWQVARKIWPTTRASEFWIYLEYFPFVILCVCQNHLDTNVTKDNGYRRNKHRANMTRHHWIIYVCRSELLHFDKKWQMKIWHDKYRLISTLKLFYLLYNCRWYFYNVFVVVCWAGVNTWSTNSL